MAKSSCKYEVLDKVEIKSISFIIAAKKLLGKIQIAVLYMLVSNKFVSIGTKTEILSL